MRQLCFNAVEAQAMDVVQVRLVCISQILAVAHLHIACCKGTGHAICMAQTRVPKLCATLSSPSTLSKLVEHESAPPVLWD